MEDIRRMEDETQKELETVRLPLFVEILSFPLSKTVCVLSKCRLRIKKNVIKSCFLIFTLIKISFLRH